MRRILVVDDDPLVRELLAAVLGDGEFELGFAEDGASALKSVEERVPDLVVLDVMMPGMDGYEVCRTLRAAHPATRIVMLTARHGEAEHATAMAAGADAFLTKPFSPLALREVMDQARR